MQKELVKRLRQHALPDPHDEREVLHAPLLTEAADEIERLYKWQREMVEKAASGGVLDGYRELATKLAKRDETIDSLRHENADLESLMHRRQFQNQKRPTERVGSDLHMGDGSAALYIRDLLGNIDNQGHGDTVRDAIDAARKEPK
jgi:hypothetical protein